MITFEKPVGAHADCKELEYIATLHQTGAIIRTNGSVTAEDVANFLTSRHGIKVDLAYIEEHLMPDLAGCMDDSTEAVFDIVEITAMLLIPHLRKMGTLENDCDDDARDFFGKVLTMIVGDVTGNHSDGPTMMLNQDTMRAILEFYGEDDVPQTVIDEMLTAAGADPEGDTALDYRRLLAATTGDIQQIKLDWDQTATTHYDDVLDGTTLDANLEDNEADEEIAESRFDDAGKQVQRIFTAPTIDFVAENYRSKSFNVILWLLVIVAFFAYAFQFQTEIGKQDCNAKFRSEFSCRVVNSIISWFFIFAQLTILGSLFVFLSTAGNSIYLQHNFSSLAGVLVGMFAITVSCILSYIFQFQFFLINTVKSEDEWFIFSYVFALILGCMLLTYQVKALLYVTIPRWVYKRMPFSNWWLTTDMARCERGTKQAASFKINRMVNSAIGHHEGAGMEDKSSRLSAKNLSRSGISGLALLNFQATADARELTGGILYTFKKMWNGSLFNEEGVWIHARLYAMNCSQWFVAVFYVIVYAVFYRLIRDIYADPLTDAPTISPAPSYVPDFEPPVDANASYYTFVLDEIVDQGSDFLSLLWENVTASRPDIVLAIGESLLNYTSAEVIQDLASSASPEVLNAFVMAAARQFDVRMMFNGTAADYRYATDNGAGRRLLEATRFLEEDFQGDDFQQEEEEIDFMPTENQAVFAVTMGGFAAFVATVSLAMVWLPSSVSTIRQFRYGAIPSLHDRQFQRYRSAPDLTTVLFGSTFWGTFYASLIIFIIIGSLSFVLVWELTRSVVVNLLANLIGIFVTIAFKMLILIFVRKALFVGFFRKRPAGGNFMLLMFECWSLGLTLGTMSVRMVKLIMIAAFYIGRLDTPLFAPGVGNVGPVPLDAHPIQFRKDLLLHEAHRHPYMERLAVIYILKLRYGDAFGTRAGGAWRLIFVMALMPWLRRYRLDDGLVDGDGSDKKTETEKALVAETAVEEEEDVVQPQAGGNDKMVAIKDIELARLKKYVIDLEARLVTSDFGQHIKKTVQDDFLLNEVASNLVSPM